MKFIIAALCLLLFSFAGITQTQETKTDTTMKEQFLGLRTCIYKVPDLAKAKEWYANAFEVEPYFDEPFYVGFNIGGFELGLLPDEHLGIGKSDNVLTYWGVENIGERYDKLISAGATKHEEPNNVGGELEVASVKDPWGNVIGIIYNPYFKIEAKDHE